MRNGFIISEVILNWNRSQDQIYKGDYVSEYEFASLLPDIMTIL
jgi:hypothetical protein